ncbi:hypothetical protein GIB67_022275 [Kingdonia uniflora]|uniref:S-acyltransferase n=1 Tax=Kingdonia uniflora TaxID=39325 RepID=A0A7J7M714_9MAGN|nr:hypothetical protein GIB67_022275 [Kingdonia uniflora]
MVKGKQDRELTGPLVRVQKTPHTRVEGGMKDLNNGVTDFTVGTSPIRFVGTNDRKRKAVAVINVTARISTDTPAKATIMTSNKFKGIKESRRSRERRKCRIIKWKEKEKRGGRDSQKFSLKTSIELQVREGETRRSNWMLQGFEERNTVFFQLLILYVNGRRDVGDNIVPPYMGTTSVYDRFRGRIRSLKTGACNYKFFLLFLIYTFLETTLDTVTLLPHFIKFFGEAKTHSISPGNLAITVLAFVINLAFALSLICFLVMHASLISSNTTSIEVHEKNRAVRWKYDLGRKKNFEQVFGTNKALWFVPMFSKEDIANISALSGLHFPTRSDIETGSSRS